MLGRLNSKLLLVAGMLVSLPAMSAECPVDMAGNDYLERVEGNIRNATNCYEAASIAEACALGSGGDVFTVSAAIDVCLSHAGEMSAEDQASRAYLMQRCTETYQSREGSMYRSFMAFCHLSATQFFANLYGTESVD